MHQRYQLSHADALRLVEAIRATLDAPGKRAALAVPASRPTASSGALKPPRRMTKGQSVPGEPYTGTKKATLDKDACVAGSRKLL